MAAIAQKRPKPFIKFLMKLTWERDFAAVFLYF